MARLVFLGTPAESVPTLRALVAAGHDVALVVTQPDRKRGRGGEVTPSPVKAAALELGLEVIHKVNDLLDVHADYGIVVAFGRLIKPALLDQITFINIHPSLLPRWRGSTPAESAILAGDTETGVCVMKLEAEMDTGPVYGRAAVPIGPNETAEALLERLFALGTELLVDALTMGLPEPQPQVGEPTFAPKLSPEDFHIDWRGDADRVARLSRIGRPWTTFRGKRLLVLSAVVANMELAPGALASTPEGVVVGTGTNAVRLLRVQPEGKPALDATAWANGARLQPEEPLG